MLKTRPFGFSVNKVLEPFQSQIWSRELPQNAGCIRTDRLLQHGPRASNMPFSGHVLDLASWCRGVWALTSGNDHPSPHTRAGVMCFPTPTFGLTAILWEAARVRLEIRSTIGKTKAPNQILFFYLTFCVQPQPFLILETTDSWEKIASHPHMISVSSALQSI